MSVKSIPELSETIENSRVKAIFEAEVEGRLRFRYVSSENDDIPVNHTIWVEEPEFDPRTDYKTGKSYNLLIEGPLDEPDLLDPRAIVWRGSLRKFEKLQLWDKLEQFMENEEPIEGEIIGINKGGLTVDIGIRAFVPLSHAILPDTEGHSDYLQTLIGDHDQFQLLEFDKKNGNVVASRKKSLEVRRKAEESTMLNRLEKGQRYKGIVKNVTNFGAFVDIGGIEGLIHVSNMRWGRVNNPRKLYTAGDEVEVEVLEFTPETKRLSLGVKQLMPNPWSSVEDRFVEGQVVKGKVVALPKFGAFVQLEEGVEGLIHVSELSWTTRISHPKDLLKKGDEVEVKILAIDQEDQQMTLSLKQATDNPWDLFTHKYKEGDIVEGEIVRIAPYGFFVEVMPGVQGIVHASDFSWSKKYEPSAQKKGEKIKARLLSIEHDKSRFSLGIKQLTEDPWEVVRQKLKVGKKAEAKVTEIVPFGVFVEVAPHVEGLIHISELSKDRVEDPRTLVHPGQTINALVLSIDDEKKKISLSLYRDEIDEETPNEYRESGEGGTSLGDIFKGAFSKITLANNDKKPQEDQEDTMKETPEKTSQSEIEENKVTRESSEEPTTEALPDPDLAVTVEMQRRLNETLFGESSDKSKDEPKTAEESTEDDPFGDDGFGSDLAINWPEHDESKDIFAQTAEIPRKTNSYDELTAGKGQEKNDDASETTQEWLKNRSDLLSEDLSSEEEVEEKKTFEIERRRSSELDKRGPSTIETIEKKSRELTQIEKKSQTLTTIEKRGSELTTIERQRGTMTVVEKPEATKAQEEKVEIEEKESAEESGE